MESGMLGNSHFSIEYLFRLVEIQNKAISISFIYGSPSHSKYKDGITLIHITNYKLEDVLPSIQNRTNTNKGTIIGVGYNNTFLLEVDTIMLHFYIEDIVEIEFR